MLVDPIGLLIVVGIATCVGHFAGYYAGRMDERDAQRATRGEKGGGA
jgi:ABC-type dipeptide/oligopeptide/nickel transport system permease subunit